jgi:hypothetical protein
MRFGVLYILCFVTVSRALVISTWLGHSFLLSSSKQDTVLIPMNFRQAAYIFDDTAHHKHNMFHGRLPGHCQPL